MWAVMEPLMPTVSGRSRPWTDHRLAVEGMAWKYRTGAPWRDVPDRFGKWNSIYKRFNRWAEDGTWEKLLAEVQKLKEVDEDRARFFFKNDITALYPCPETLPSAGGNLTTM